MDFEIQLSIIEKDLLDIENSNDLVPFDVFTPPKSIAKAEKSRNRIYKSLEIESHGDYCTLPSEDSDINRIFDIISSNNDKWIIDDLLIQLNDESAAKWYFFDDSFSGFEGKLKAEESQIIAPLSKFPKNSLFARNDIVKKDLVDIIQESDSNSKYTPLVGRKTSINDNSWFLIETSNALGTEPESHFHQIGSCTYKNKYLSNLSSTQSKFIEELPISTIRVANFIVQEEVIPATNIGIVEFRFEQKKLCFSKALKEKIEKAFPSTVGNFQSIILAK